MSEQPDLYSIMDRIADASGRIIYTKDGLWIADGLSDRIIGRVFGELVDLACKVQNMHSRQELNIEPLDKIGLDAKFGLIRRDLELAQKDFEESQKKDITKLKIQIETLQNFAKHECRGCRENWVLEAPKDDQVISPFHAYPDDPDSVYSCSANNILLEIERLKKK